MVSGISGIGYSIPVSFYQPVRRQQGQINGQDQMETQGKQALEAAPASPWAAKGTEEPARSIPPVYAAVSDGEEQTVPDRFLRKGVDPVEYAVRMRIQYLDPGAYEEAEEAGQLPGIGNVQETAEDGECQTCEQRRYQDGSDDMGVSFQTPTRISPEAAGAMVRMHEQEHVTRERAKAAREDRRVVSQSVTLHTDICPECGKVYISGGTTRTTTASRPEQPEPVSQEARKPYSAVA